MAWLPSVVIASVGAALLLDGAASAMRSHRSYSWPRVKGRVTRAWVQYSCVDDGDGGENCYWSPIVEYEFSVMGMLVRGDRIRFGTVRLSERAAFRAIAPFTVNRAIGVSYDPVSGTSVLEPGLAGSELLQTLAGLLLLCGALCVAFC